MILDIRHKDRFVPHIETAAEMRESFFVDVYRSAARNLTEIIRRGAQDAEGGRGRGDAEGSSTFYWDVREPNTLIAFVGDRGVGKSSAMLSFVEALRHDHKSELWRQLAPEDYRWIQDSSFHIIPVIDPTRLNDNETVLTNVVARLLAQFKDRCKEEERKGEKHWDRQRDFIVAATEAFKSIRGINIDPWKEDYPGGELESLENIANVQKMRKALHNTVVEYLRFVESDGAKPDLKKTFLVIAIDDLDMNMKNAMRLAEEIRKFFMIPNVIVMMALSIKQMTSIIERDYYGFFKELIDKSVASTEPYDLAVKYMNKLIPLTRRNHLPSLDIFSPSEVEVIADDEGGVSGGGRQTIPITRYILDQIHKKTGLLLLKNDLGTHPVVPTNLRGLIHFLELLKNLPSVRPLDMLKKRLVLSSCLAQKEISNETYEEIRELKEEISKENEALSGNLTNLENYIIDYYVNGNSGGGIKRNNELLTRIAQLISELPRTPWEHLNAQIIISLYDLFKDDGDADDEDMTYLDWINRATKYPQSVSIGDVLYLLGCLSRERLTGLAERMIGIVLLLYNIRLMRVCFIGTDGKGLANMKRMLGGFIYNPDNRRLARIRGRNDWLFDIPIPMLEYGKLNYTHIFERLSQWHIYGKRLLERDAQMSGNTEETSYAIGDTLRTMEHLQFFTAFYGKLDELEPQPIRGGHPEAVNTKSGGIRDWEYRRWRAQGQPGHYYNDLSLNTYKRKDGRTKYFSVNLLAGFVNALTPFETCERLYEGLFNGAEHSVTLEMLSGADLHKSEEQENNFTLEKMIRWQAEHLFIIPLYSIDFIRVLFDHLARRADRLDKRFIRRYDNTDDQTPSAMERLEEDNTAFVLFWENLNASVSEILQKIDYLTEDEKQAVETALKECPLYKAAFVDDETKEFQDLNKMPIGSEQEILFRNLFKARDLLDKYRGYTRMDDNTFLNEILRNREDVLTFYDDIAKIMFDKNEHRSYEGVMADIRQGISNASSQLMAMFDKALTEYDD